MKQIIHQNPWFKIEKNNLKNGNYFVVRKTPAVFVIAQTLDKKIVFIKEYRFPINQTIWQLPAGGIDNHPPLVAAKRELLEETGLTGSNWQKLGQFFVAPGHEDTKIFVYSTIINQHQTNKKLENNIKEIRYFSPKKIKAMISNNLINCGITLASLNLFFQKLKATS